MSVEAVTPAWTHQQITAAEYDSWTEEQCAGIEIVDGIGRCEPQCAPPEYR